MLSDESRRWGLPAPPRARPGRPYSAVPSSLPVLPSPTDRGAVAAFVDACPRALSMPLRPRIARISPLLARALFMSRTVHPRTAGKPAQVLRRVAKKSGAGPVRSGALRRAVSGTVGKPPGKGQSRSCRCPNEAPSNPPAAPRCPAGFASTRDGDPAASASRRQHGICRLTAGHCLVETGTGSARTGSANDDQPTPMGLDDQKAHPCKLRLPVSVICHPVSRYSKEVQTGYTLSDIVTALVPLDIFV